MPQKILYISPPFTQLNTPYPATAYLKGFTNTLGIDSYQCDLGIEVILTLFSHQGLKQIFEMVTLEDLSDNSLRIFSLQKEYLKTIDSVIQFLQHKDDTLAYQICNENYLPQASRFEQLEDLEWAFGTLGIRDKARHLATLYLEDLSDFIQENIDPHFGFSRYAEKLAISAPSFDELNSELQSDYSFIDAILISLLEEKIKNHLPTLVIISVPFPGNLYGALRCGEFLKKEYPTIKVGLGGGYPNTELRSLSESRVFDYVDFITLDDGEAPIKHLLDYLENPEFIKLKRTFMCLDGEVKYFDNSTEKDIAQRDVGTPDYSDLLTNDYLSVLEIANPMHRLWSDGRWNKLTLAHGCYWGKCSFCDISLDYIERYEPITPSILCDRIEKIIEQTGETGFHFVDEAAPPALMRSVALEIIRRKLTVTWWTNIRFEKNFTRDLCRLLKASGCIAVSGGLEVASDRLLDLIQKGVTVEQVAQVTDNFTSSGIIVHAYLMYGYPTQTIQETVDSLEMVRQLFEIGILQSGFWHQFALTTHSPVGIAPADYGVTPDLQPISFANNDIQFTDKTGIDHDQFSFGLKKSLLNYMHEIGFDLPLQKWFDFKIPKTTIPKRYIEKCLNYESDQIKPTAKIVWIGNAPLVDYPSNDEIQLSFFDKTSSVDIVFEKAEGEWLIETLQTLALSQNPPMTFGELKASFKFEDFNSFWESEEVEALREIGLLVL